MRRRAASTFPIVVSFAVLATLSSGDARADLAPPRPAPAAKPAASAAAVEPTPSADAEPAPSAPADPLAGLADEEALAEAPPEAREFIKGLLAIKWQKGPTKGQLGDLAEIDVPEGFVFTDGEGTRKYLELTKNPTDGSELGIIMAPEFAWSVTFNFSDIGYVKDEEKGALDADKILESLREGNKSGNDARKARGWHTVTLTGWAQQPKY